MKKPLLSSTRGAIFHTKHASNANVVRVVLLDANSYLALSILKSYRAPPCFGRHVKPSVPAAFAVVSTHQSALGPRGGLRPVLLVVNP
jgi:hypothetical protein